MCRIDGFKHACVPLFGLSAARRAVHRAAAMACGEGHAIAQQLPLRGTQRQEALRGVAYLSHTTGSSEKSP